MNTTLYEVDAMPEYPRQLNIGLLDGKRRVIIPEDFRKVIAGRNAFYVAHLGHDSSPFRYEKKGIYLSREIIGVIDTAGRKEDSDRYKKNLVQILNEPEHIADISKINSRIYITTRKLGSMEFLIGYAFFDWKLYLEKAGVEREKQVGTTFSGMECSTLELDAQGRIVMSSFMNRLGIQPEGYVGFRGFRDFIIIGNPEYLLAPERLKVQKEGGLMQRIKDALHFS